MKFLFAAVFLFFGTDNTQTLTINITNITQTGGTLRVGVYDPNHGFGSETEVPTYFKLIPITKTETQTVVFELPAGRWAVAVYHDLNNNQKLDTNKLGLPKEPYCFSNNYRPKLSRPKFDHCSFEMGELPKKLSLKMID